MKYPKTHHLKGSKGLESDDQVELEDLDEGTFVVEEKIDGTEVCVSLDGTELDIRSRGEPVDGSRSEFAALKSWLWTHVSELRDLLGDRYVMWAEWCWLKHTVFYDALPSHFLQHDLWDRTEHGFVDTETRLRMTKETPFVSVPVLHQSGLAEFLSQRSEENRDYTDDLSEMCSTSRFVSDAAQAKLSDIISELDLNGTLGESVERQTLRPRLAEGVYVKVERGGFVDGFYKWVRQEFLDTIAASPEHWRTRVKIRNLLEEHAC